jgi:hypothetical protein
MKSLMPSLILATLILNPVGARAQTNLENDPGYLGIDKAIDLRTVRPEVNINLPRFLLKDAAATLNGGPDDPFASAGLNFADLVKDVKLIRVVVIEAGKTNQSALKSGVGILRAELEAKWTPVVSVPDENVGIYVRSDAGGETMSGLALLVYDGGDAVIANVVGQVSIGKIIKLASHFDKLPKDLLKKINVQNSESTDKPASTPSASTSPEAK